MRAGDVLANRYQLTEMLGKGGMAEVWRAEDLELRRAVAVKFLRPDPFLAACSDEAERREEFRVVCHRFRREGSLLGRLHHPGIPELYDSGTHGDEPYIVMRYIDGVSLQEFMDHHMITVDVAAAIAAQITDALICAHALPVVHRDLKPYNILIGQDGTAVLIDFGIAKPLGPGTTGYTRQGSTVGSRGYQAPEQILEGQITPATDLYALGCVLYRMLAGRPPFIGDGMPAQHLSHKPLPLLAFASHIPAELDGLTLQLLEKSPDDRPLDARAVRARLDPYLPKLGDAAPSPRFNPDPTAVFRTPRSHPQHVAPRTPRVAQEPRRHGPWLRRREVEAMLARVQSQLRSSDGDDVSRIELLSLHETARSQWGPADPLVLSVHLAAADVLRVAGDCHEATAVYQAVVDLSAVTDGSAHPAIAIEARLGIGECRIPFGDLPSALQAMIETVDQLAHLPTQRALQLARRCREVGLELDELRLSGVSAVVERLDQWESKTTSTDDQG
jgi:serine/threonine protein kinase